MRFGTNIVDRFRAFPYGRVDAAIYLPTQTIVHANRRFRVDDDVSVAAGNFYAPLIASLGVVAEGRQHFLAEENRPSRVWHAVTASNTLCVAWQNVLPGWNAETPVSFMVEYSQDGHFTYRYDFSRLDCDTLTNILAGVCHCGNSWFTNSIPTNVTSMTFWPIGDEDFEDTDPDGDGIATIDELFVYHTNPRVADSDYDGLSDYDELFVHETDPLDSHSVSSGYPDGFALALGGEDPLSCPDGSTNTIYEHIFYSGTTNGTFAYPQSTEEIGVLKIIVSGSGTGELIVGESVVPLIASVAAPQPMQLRSASGNAATNTLLLAIGKGEKKDVWFGSKPDGLEVAIDSDDLLIGRMPNPPLRPHGWIAFPHTDATIPCIHDFTSNGKTVTLAHGEEFPGLAATWSSDGEGVAVTNNPPVSAEIYGSFPKSATRAIGYEVDHPDKLNSSQAVFTQTLRFCPQITEEEETHIYSGGEYIDGEEIPDANCSCASGGSCDCCSGEWCHCWNWNCPCNLSKSPEVENEEEAEEAYTNIVYGVLTPLADVLYLYRANSRTVHLTVPDGEPRHCCPCPEHWASNYVAKAYASNRLNVSGLNEHGIAYESCDATVSGVHPSREFGDSHVLFVTNGVSYKSFDFTVLGVRFELEDGKPDLSSYNHLSQSFGFPITVCTNLSEASTMVLRTDVLLPNGVVKLSILDATGDFQLWLPEWWDNNANYHTPEMLLSSDILPEIYFSIRQWRSIIRRYGSDGVRTLPVKIVSSSQGHCDLKLEYAASNGAGYAHDFAVQRITSIAPPLLPDYDGDGRIDLQDMAFYLQGRLFCFWTNEETAKGRYVGDGLFSTLTSNSGNGTVDGEYDLLNFFPLALDVFAFPQSWKAGLSFKLSASGSDGASFNFCLSDGAWTAAGEMYTNDVLTVDGEALSSADVSPLGADGTALPIATVDGFDAGCGLVVAEALREGATMRLSVVDSEGREFFGFALPMMIGDIERFYRWANLRWACGDSSGEATELSEPPCWPDWLDDGRHFVFVHGYNVDAAAARTWANQMFKRLWIAGSRSRFTAVDWYGDSSQFPTLFHGDVSPDYYANVIHAFMTASNFVETVSSLPGTNKVMLAHSLGNMLVSSATVDCGLRYDRYYMLNAAVPMEAYDAEEASSNMIDSAWNDVPLDYRASGWSKLFASSTNDFRSALSWQGRFACMSNAVNCYSSTEDVLENPTENGYGAAWARQELLKGTAAWHVINGVLPWNWGERVSCEGGWGINTYYAVNPTCYLPGSGFSASVSNLTREAVIEHPLFTPFRAEEDAMHSTNLFTIADAGYRERLRAKFLGDAIPATSFAAGANPVYTDAVSGNIDYENCKSGVWPIGEGKWGHSDIKNVAYMFNWKIFKLIICNSKGDENGNDQ